MMIEKIDKLADLLEKYEVVTTAQPKKGDLVYVQSQQGIFEVIHVDRMYVKITFGKGLFAKLPYSHYKLVKKKERPS